MAVFVSMPKLGLNMTKGTIVKWLVKEGDAVVAGQPLVEVETDKVIQEVESPASGILTRIVQGSDREVPCQDVIAVITEPGEPLPDMIPEVMADGVRPKSDVEVVVSREAGRKLETAEKRKRVNISPAAKKLARELGVDVNTITPAGKRITKKDVEETYQARQAAATVASAASEPVPQTEARVEPLTGIRRAIAEHMSLSARTVARVGLTLETDTTELIAWRELLKQQGDKVSYSELLAKIIAHALHEFPYMNSQLAGDDIRLMVDVNVGIAVDTERGLVVPVIRNTDSKGVLEIHREFAELVERARSGRSTMDDLSGGTFTITNLGSYEIEEFLPIVNVPECAILGVGAIIKKPVVVDDKIEIRPLMAITLSFDHRLVDGAPAARFLQRIKHMIENPLELLY